MAERIPKIESLIQHVVASEISEMLEDDSASVTVTRVDVSPDMRHAIIWLGILGSDSDQERIFKKISYLSSQLQAKVAKKLSTKYVPRLNFKIDTGGAYAADIDKLLRSL